MQKQLMSQRASEHVLAKQLWLQDQIHALSQSLRSSALFKSVRDERGDVPGWVLVVLMTTGLVTAIWTIAAPRLSAILKNSLDAMNGIR
jgi:hypothetical protein